MKGIIKAEFIKLFRRKDFLLLCTMVFLPLLYAIGVASNSSSLYYQGSEKSTFFSFFTQMFTFAHMVMIYYLIASMCSIKSLKGEIENKSIRLYIQRAKSRTQIYIAKLIASISSLLMVFILFFFINLICYYALVIRRSDIASKSFFNPNTLTTDICLLACIIMYFIMMVFISFCICTYTKTSVSLAISMFFVLFLSYLEQFPFVKYLSPIFYIQQLSDLTYKQSPIFVTMYMTALCISICALTYFIGTKNFIKSDV